MDRAEDVHNVRVTIKEVAVSEPPPLEPSGPPTPKGKWAKTRLALKLLRSKKIEESPANGRELKLLRISDSTKKELKKVRGSPSILSDSKWRLIWDLIIIVVVAYYSFKVPINFAFTWNNAYNAGTITIECVCTILLLVNVAVLSRTAVMGQNKILIENIPFLRYNYMKSWCGFDVLGAFPFDLIAVAAVGGEAPVVVSLSALRLLNISFIGRVWPLAEKGTQTVTYYTFIFVVAGFARTLLFVVITLHWLTVASHRLDIGKNYIDSFYWVMQTVSTAGFGDVPIMEDGQRAFAVCSFVVGSFFQAWVMGSLVSASLRSDVESDRNDKMRATLDVLHHFSVPDELQQEVLAYQFHLLRQSMRSSYKQVLTSLPNKIKKRIGLSFKVKMITQVEMLSKAPAEILVELAQRMKPAVFEPDDLIIQDSTEGKQMYFLSHGFADQYSSTGEFKRTIRRGGFFGEETLLNAHADAMCIKASTYCEVYILKKEDFDQTAEAYPLLKDAIESYRMRDAPSSPLAVFKHQLRRLSRFTGSRSGDFASSSTSQVESRYATRLSAEDIREMDVSTSERRRGWAEKAQKSSPRTDAHHSSIVPREDESEGTCDEVVDFSYDSATSRESAPVAAFHRKTKGDFEKFEAKTKRLEASIKDVKESIVKMNGRLRKRLDHLEVTVRELAEID